MFDNLSAETLVALLEQVPEAELKGLTLLREHRPAPGQLFPADVAREDVTAATVGMVAYAQDCAALAKQVANLAPAPLDIEMSEFGL